MAENSKKQISRKLLCLGIMCVGINSAKAGDVLFEIDQVRNFFQWFIPGNVQREILPDIENGLVHMANHVTDEERRLMDILDFMCERRLDVRVENGQLLVRPLQPVQENYVVNQVTQIIQFIRNRNIHTLCAGGYIFLSIMRDIYNVYAMTHSPETS